MLIKVNATEFYDVQSHTQFLLKPDGLTVINISSSGAIRYTKPEEITSVWTQLIRRHVTQVHQQLEIINSFSAPRKAFGLALAEFEREMVARRGG